MISISESFQIDNSQYQKCWVSDVKKICWSHSARLSPLCIVTLYTPSQETALWIWEHYPATIWGNSRCHRSTRFASRWWNRSSLGSQGRGHPANWRLWQWLTSFLNLHGGGDFDAQEGAHSAHENIDLITFTSEESSNDQGVLGGQLVLIAYDPDSK